MASHCHQYIFGEFSPDEFTQFFLTPQHYVELPPVSDKVSCAGQSSGSGCGHVRFGVDELMEPEPTGTAEAAQKLSSNLNPQAPEFILGCQTPQEATLGLPMADGADFESGDGPEPGLPTLDGSSALSGLVQPERRRKKKRPPGYYSYMEGQGCSAATHAKASLVNGHTPVSHTVEPEDELREGSPGAELSSCGQGSPETVASAGANSWICESPRELTPDLAAVVVPAPDHSAMLSPSFSLSHELAGGGRTADQPAVESPELQDSGGQSPCVPSPPPPPQALTIAPASAVPDGAECGVSRPPDAQPGHVFCAPMDRQKQDSESTDSETQPGAQHTWPCGSAISPAPPAGFSIVNPPKSWASLFHNSKPMAGSPQAYVQVKSEPAGPASVVTPEHSVEVDESPLHMSEDPLARRLAELIENVKLIHKPVSLQPRGLINKGNWCYINATLQALVACPPMYHLMKSLPVASEARRPCSSTPMINNFVRLVNEFSNMPVPSKAKQQAAGDKVMKDIRPGIPFEPSYIYRLLTVIKSSPSEKGRQEDAEEYLGYILNGLHEEMLALKKLLSPQEETEVSTLNGPESPSGGEVDSAGREEEGSDDEWEQVGPRNRTSVMRQTDYVRTPITDIFGGHIRSVVYQQSSRESATLQPFFTLQLDIQSEKVRTVQEALENLVARECVQGYTSKAKQEVEVSRRVTLEELPPVLLLHLKRFVFEKNGGSQKLVKNVDYPIDLEISKDLLSPGVRSKIFKGQRTYRLFAVVYHHGNSATGGHYTTDVFHIGLSGWLRIDDQAVKVISQYQVLKQTAERTAYLLYYRRLDLL